VGNRINNEAAKARLLCDFEQPFKCHDGTSGAFWEAAADQRCVARIEVEPRCAIHIMADKKAGSLVFCVLFADLGSVGESNEQLLPGKCGCNLVD
jgi:hypothetical protein